MIWKILQAVIGLAYQKASLLLLFLKEVLVKVLRAVLFIISGRITIFEAGIFSLKELC